MELFNPPWIITVCQVDEFWNVYLKICLHYWDVMYISTPSLLILLSCFSIFSIVNETALNRLYCSASVLDMKWPLEPFVQPKDLNDQVHTLFLRYNKQRWRRIVCRSLWPWSTCVSRLSRSVLVIMKVGFACAVFRFCTSEDRRFSAAKSHHRKNSIGIDQWRWQRAKSARCLHLHEWSWYGENPAIYF